MTAPLRREETHVDMGLFGIFSPYLSGLVFDANLVRALAGFARVSVKAGIVALS